MNRQEPRWRESRDRSAFTLLPRLARRALAGALVLVTASLLTGCLMEVSEDPETQPLEIIVGEGGSCALNVNEVGAGTHEVTPIVEAGGATVRILDSSDEVVFTLTVRSREAKGGGNRVPSEDQGSVRLEAGEHRVECVQGGDSRTTHLSVVPARPGYHDGADH